MYVSEGSERVKTAALIFKLNHRRFATPVEISAPRSVTPSDPAQVTTPGSLHCLAVVLARPARLDDYCARLRVSS